MWYLFFSAATNRKMPKTRRNRRKQRKGRATRRKQRGGASRYPGLLVTSRGSDPEDPPVLMSYKDYKDSTAI